MARVNTATDITCYMQSVARIMKWKYNSLNGNGHGEPVGRLESPEGVKLKVAKRGSKPGDYLIVSEMPTNTVAPSIAIGAACGPIVTVRSIEGTLLSMIERNRMDEAERKYVASIRDANPNLLVIKDIRDLGVALGVTQIDARQEAKVKAAFEKVTDGEGRIEFTGKSVKMIVPAPGDDLVAELEYPFKWTALMNEWHGLAAAGFALRREALEVDEIGSE
jgi:hypothetical protein